MKLQHSFTIAGRPFSIEIGKVAEQADAAVLARYGDTVVLATVVASKKESALDYFPLSVEYVEKLYAGGRIKGSRWVKREGKPTDESVLRGRLIDRSIRPLFPKVFKHDVQVVITVLSVDGDNDPDMVGMIGVATALSISKVPWNGPIAAVRMGYKNGKVIVNPTAAEREGNDLDLVVSSTKDKVMMIEAGANQVPEDVMFEAMQAAQTEIKSIIKNIEEVVKKVKPVKIDVSDKEKAKEEKLETIKKAIKKHGASINDTLTKQYLKGENAGSEFPKLIDTILAELGEDYKREDIVAGAEKIFYDYSRDLVMTKNKRLDGRAMDEVRPLTIEAGVLPRVHGSAIFQRGSTQALTITTLGSPSMEQWLESAEGETTKRYIHHYEMPPYSVGETGRVGFASRREVGHGALAERALEAVIPDVSVFPYTIRVVSEIMSSNGSTSMASTCGSTLSLMDAGVPLKEPVAGISVGLVTKGDKYVLLTDIMGVEDFNGDMDFKVAGTKNGITAIQLDMKIDGITFEMIKETLERARTTRMFILEKMLKVIPAPRKEISKYAPKIETVTIPVERIGEVIGPGGKIIKSIIASTGADVNVDDDGRVTIAGTDQEAVTKAVDWVKSIVREIKPGEEFTGTVKRILNFGAFVEFLPGKEGMVHLSQMSMEYVKTAEDIVQVGQEVKVRVMEIDDQGRINLSMLTEEQSNQKRTAARSAGPREGGEGGGGYRSGGGDRGGRGGYHRDSRGGGRGGDRGGRRERYTHEHLKDNR